MEQLCFCVFDVKAAAFLPPWFAPTQAVAVRIFGDCCRDVGHQFGVHPEDYTLHELGLFRTDTGEFTVSGPKLVLSGLQVVGGDK